MATSPLRAEDPVRLGRYRLVSRLGEGGMGTVFKAEDPSGRTVAVKVIRPEFAHDQEFRGRFRSEVARAGQVPPFCTAEVIDADPDHETPYLVVDYVDGPSLEEVIKENGPLAPGTLHSVAVGVATALVAIHGAGVVHRDLKPANVLFGIGTPKVIDFGIARALDGSSGHTRTDQMVGTIAYMAPERFDTRPGRAGPPADVFAWAVVIAYAATGTTPFASDTPMATVGRILTQPPDLTGLPGYLLDLVTRALSKEPVERPTALQLLDSLLAVHGDASREFDQQPELRRAAVAARHTSRLATVRRRGRRLLAAAAALIVTASAIGVAVHYDGVARAQTSAAQRQRTTVVEQASQLAAQRLLAESARVIDTDPGLARRTALGAQKINPGAAGRAAVTAALTTRHEAEALSAGQMDGADFRPDGRAVASVTVDGSVSLWDVSVSGVFRHVAMVPGGPYADAAFSPDGTMLAAAGAEVRLWDVRRLEAPRLIASYRPGGGTPQDITFSPDGSRLLVDSGRSVRMWRLRDARTLWTVRTSGGNHAITVVDPAGRLLVRHNNSELEIWQLRPAAKPTLLTTMPFVHVTEVAFSSDGKRMALALPEPYYSAVYDMTRPARPTRLSPAGPASPLGTDREIAINRAGTMLAIGARDGVISLWDVRTPARPLRVATMRGHDGAVMSVRFSPDDSRLLSTSRGSRHTTMLWRVETPLQPKRIAVLDGGADQSDVGFSADDSVLTWTEDTVKVWDLSELDKPRKTFALHGNGQYGIRAGPDSRMVFAGAIYEVSGKGVAKQVLPAPGQENEILDMHPTGNLAASADFAGQKVLLHRLAGSAEPAVVASIAVDELMGALFTADGQTLIIAARSGTGSRMQRWDVTDPAQPRLRSSITIEGAFGLAADGTGARIAASGEKAVELWHDSAGPRYIPTSVFANGAAGTMAMSADGAILAVTTPDGTQLWDITDENRSILLQTLGGAVSAVEFSSGQPMLGVAGAYGSEVWDTGTMLATVADPVPQACRVSAAGPTRAEWQRYAPEIPYQEVC